MSLRLILIRHAKSARPAGVGDRDRPLNDRGRGAAAELGRWLGEAGLVPDQALVSDAARTRETWERIAAALPGAPAPRLEPRLYEAAAEEILSVLHGAAGRTVAIVGHNPGIGAFARALVDAPPDHDRFVDYPTGATLVVRFDTDDWRSVRRGTGTAERFVIPREL